MEKLTVHGLVVRETQTGEADKILTLVTMEQGRLTVIGKGVRSLRNRNMLSCQLFAYSVFTLRKSKNYYYIVETERLETFHQLQGDLDKMAIGAYLCDVCEYVSVEGSPDPELLRLTLNALYALSKKDVASRLVKGAFEFKCACAAGFAPELSACGLCGGSAFDRWYLDVMNGRVLCGECRDFARREALAEPEGDRTAQYYYYLSGGVLAALQYIKAAPVNRFLSFSLGEKDLRIFAEAAEKYLLHHTEHAFYTLSFYKSILLET